MPIEKQKPEDQKPTAETSSTGGFQWYVAHTYSGHEYKVKTNLEKRLRAFELSDKVGEIYIPTQEKIEVKEGKRREVTERLFPGYVLINMIMSDETVAAVQGTPGVTSFVGSSEQALPLREDEVEAIRKFSEQETPEFEADFTVGEGVKIIDGPFSDFIGTVDNIDKGKGKIKVLVSIFGRETPVELDFLQVGKL